jgi:hypothetical protein
VIDGARRKDIDVVAVRSQALGEPPRVQLGAA